MTIGSAKSPDSESLFDIEDLSQDTDATIIGAALLSDPGLSLASLVIDAIEYGGPSAVMNRYEAALRVRFGDVDGLRAAARSVFAIEPDSKQGLAFVLLRSLLLRYLDTEVNLGEFETAELQAVAEAYVDAVLSRV